MTSEWIKNESAATDQWDRPLKGGEYGYVSQYEGCKRYNWQAARGDHRLSGIVDDRETAMAKADEALAMPMDEFNSLVVAELLEEFAKIERHILKLQPAAKLLPGYHAGYEDGIADTKRKIDEALCA